MFNFDIFEKNHSEMKKKLFCEINTILGTISKFAVKSVKKMKRGKASIDSIDSSDAGDLPLMSLQSDSNLKQLRSRYNTIYYSKKHEEEKKVSTFSLSNFNSVRPSTNEILKNIDNILLPPPPTSDFVLPDSSANESEQTMTRADSQEELIDENSMPRFEINLDTVDNYFGFKDKFNELQLMNQMMHHQGAKALDQFCTNATSTNNFDEESMLESLKTFLEGFASTVHTQADNFIDMISERISQVENINETLHNYQSEIKRVRDESTFLSIEDLRQELPSLPEPEPYPFGPEKRTSIYIFPAESPLNVVSLEKLGTISDGADPSTLIKLNNHTNVMETPSDFFQQPISYTNNNDPFATPEIKVEQHRFCPDFFGSIERAEDASNPNSMLRTHNFNSRYLSKQNFISYKSHSLQSRTNTNSNSQNKKYFQHSLPQVASSSIPDFSPDAEPPPVPANLTPLTQDMVLIKAGPDAEILRQFIKTPVQSEPKSGIRVQFSFLVPDDAIMSSSKESGAGEDDDEELPPAPELIIPDND